VSKTWSEPDVFKINQSDSIRRYNDAFKLREEKYKYDKGVISEDVWNMVDDLNNKGYVILKDVIDKEILKKVRSDAEKIWDEGIKVKGASGIFSQLKKPNHAIELAVNDPIYNCPSIVPLVFNDISLVVATAFYECIPAIGTLNLRKSFVNSNVEPRGTQMWHVDRNSPRIIKTFMYLNDVDDDGGPFCLIEGCRKNMVNGEDGRPFFYSNSHRMSDKWVEETFGVDKIKKLTANMGDMIITNQTGLYHKGLKPTKNERGMLTTNWVIHDEDFAQKDFGIRKEDYDNLPEYKKPLTDFLRIR
tara:strand:+ start:271 stop:1176 length:906 start_codon:yes stop_codon:yes gene_type:complete